MDDGENRKSGGGYNGVNGFNVRSFNINNTKIDNIPGGVIVVRLAL